MGTEEYAKALKSGRKEYQARLMRGERPYLQALDSTITQEQIAGYESLGQVQIPMEQIIGTRYESRCSSFAANFMPIFDQGSEFETKWSALSTSAEEEGIRDPIKAVEYMNRFYVEEGNKRVSVMKFFDAAEIPGTVTRILPIKTEEKKVKVYYEYVEFSHLSGLLLDLFSEPGQYAALQAAVGKGPAQHWTEEDRREFKFVLSRFTDAFVANGWEKGGKISAAEGLLAFLNLYKYEEVLALSGTKLQELVQKRWTELSGLDEEQKIELKLDPTEEKKASLGQKTLRTLIGRNGKPHLKIAFVHMKNAVISSWTYSHELGRAHLENVFGDEITTIKYDDVTEENIDEVLKQAVEAGCDAIFTTSPVFARASVKTAIAYPQVKIVNCSLNTTHKAIRTYYVRMHEAKFVLGAIAGAMAENNRIYYVTDYPLYGTIAHINAFALGAKMVNPRAQVYLDWFTLKNNDPERNIRMIGPTVISGRDMVTPEQQGRLFGLYTYDRGTMHNLAMPLCHWGKMYERLVRQIQAGNWEQDDNLEKAVNYWWGMSSDVVDVLPSQNLPVGVHRLERLLKQTIRSGEFNLFSGKLYSQTGIVHESEEPMTPEETMEMDWLVDNVIGRIPALEELTEQAVPVVLTQGLPGKKG